MNNTDKDITEEQLRALFEKHADQDLLKQFFEDRAGIVLETSEETELECTAVGV
jgi:hypothetical protein